MAPACTGRVTAPVRYASGSQGLEIAVEVGEHRGVVVVELGEAEPRGTANAGEREGAIAFARDDRDGLELDLAAGREATEADQDAEAIVGRDALDAQALEVGDDRRGECR